MEFHAVHASLLDEVCAAPNKSTCVHKFRCQYERNVFLRPDCLGFYLKSSKLLNADLIGAKILGIECSKPINPDQFLFYPLNYANKTQLYFLNLDRTAISNG